MWGKVRRAFGPNSPDKKKNKDGSAAGADNANESSPAVNALLAGSGSNDTGFCGSSAGGLDSDVLKQKAYLNLLIAGNQPHSSRGLPSKTTAGAGGPA